MAGGLGGAAAAAVNGVAPGAERSEHAGSGCRKQAKDVAVQQQGAAFVGQGVENRVQKHDADTAALSLLVRLFLVAALLHVRCQGEAGSLGCFWQACRTVCKRQLFDL